MDGGRESGLLEQGAFLIDEGDINPPDLPQPSLVSSSFMLGDDGDRSTELTDGCWVTTDGL
jgi:hypothetical protein